MKNTAPINTKTETTGADPLCLPAPYKIKNSATNTSGISVVNSIRTNPANAVSADKILHEKFTLYGRNAREWMRKCALLLPEIEKREIWKKRGFSSIYEYAAKLAGMNREIVNESLRVLRGIEDKPELITIAEVKGINAVKPLVNIATTETAGFWAKKAMEMSKNTLEVYVREFRKSQENAFLPRKEITMDLESEVAEKLQKLKGQSEWNEIMQKLLAAYETQVEAQKPAPEEIAEKAKSRHIPTAIKKYATAKTNGTCAFPGCAKLYKILHHTNRFALTHKHNPDQLAPLCKAHERLAHLGLIENEEKPPEKWRMREEPDRTEEKYEIDQKVLKYRAAFG